MEEEYINTVSDLKQKTRQLIALYEKAKHENLQLHNENKKLKDQIKQKEAEYFSLKEDYTKLELAKSLASVDSSHDAKIKINRIVREIDNCIALLNK
ncbi:MAG: hypothetical protein ACLFPH_04735 [Bacteroidales bacterium]